MGKRKKQQQPRSDDKLGPVVMYKPLEVTERECQGDTTKMIKRFCKKTRKEEILKPFYRKLLYWETKSQKRRRQRLKGTYEWKKQQSREADDEKK